MVLFLVYRSYRIEILQYEIIYLSTYLKIVSKEIFWKMKYEIIKLFLSAIERVYEKDISPIPLYNIIGHLVNLSHGDKHVAVLYSLTRTCFFSVAFFSSHFLFT